MTTGSGGSRTPSAFDVSVMEHIQLTGALLGILALVCAAFPRRVFNALAAAALGLGAAWLVRWQLDPPTGTVTNPPFDWPLWLCAAALAVAALAAVALALTSRSTTDKGQRSGFRVR
jgi:hypothetical protein